MQLITSKDNKIVKHATLLNSSAKERRKEGLFVAEGLRLCKEVLINGIDIHTLLLSDKIQDKYLDITDCLREKANNTFILADSLFEKISDTKTPQGIMCICSSDSLPKLDISNRKKYLALENISDPLNMGTIFRTADALGIDGIILSKNCCDIFSPKVVRGSMGAIFRLPTCFVEDMSAFVNELNESGFNTLAAVVGDYDYPITSVDITDGTVVFIGNEANGLTKETSDACKHRVTIPMNGNAESLNAAMASGIIMWEMVRNQGRKDG